MVPDELIGNLGDVHLYSNHLEQAKEQITRQPMKLPLLKMSDLVETDVKKYGTFVNANLDMFISRLESTDFKIENYQSHETIKAPLSN
jgi:thymidylate synthase